MGDTLLVKGRLGVRPGQIPTVVSYDVPASPTKKAHHVRRRQWINPEKAIGTKAKIDWEFIDKTGVRIPAPDEINPNISPKIANEYFKMFYRGEEPDFQKRLHRHEGAGKLHPAGKSHKGEKTQKYHKDEFIKFENEYYRRHEESSWLDQYNIQIKTIPIRIGEFRTQATQYSIPKGPTVLAWERDNIPYVYSREHLPKPIKFVGKRPNVDALGTIQRIFEKELVKKAVDEMIQLENFRENIIIKADDLLNHSLEDNHMICSNFNSGEDEINLSGIDGNYSVSVNQIPMISTDNLQAAISKYYSEIGKIMNSQNEDKDLALELLGERLITMNREIRPMIEKLGSNNGTAKWLKDLDFSELSLETDNDGILKFLFLPAITTAESPRVAQVQMVTPQPEMGQEKDAVNAPSKGELKHGDYKKYSREEINQKPIEEKGPNLINPASIMS